MESLMLLNVAWCLRSSTRKLVVEREVKVKWNWYFFFKVAMKVELGYWEVCVVEKRI